MTAARSLPSARTDWARCSATAWRSTTPTGRRLCRAEFARRRGYQLEPELWRLVDDGPASAGFRADYHRTLSELYEDNFLVPLADWAHGHGVPLRVQGYGEPPATLASYAHVDGIEGEQWGWTSDATGPSGRARLAHHLGVPVVSSETWTWVHAPSFRATPLDLLGEAHEHFLLGVNQLIGHGWPCSPRPDGPGLGWFFYASARAGRPQRVVAGGRGPDGLPAAAVRAAAPR